MLFFYFIIIATAVAVWVNILQGADLSSKIIAALATFLVLLACARVHLYLYHQHENAARMQIIQRNGSLQMPVGSRRTTQEIILRGLSYDSICSLKTVIYDRSIAEYKPELDEFNKNTNKVESMNSYKAVRDNVCSICFDEYIDRDVLTVLPCKHQYHQQCIIEWLLQHTECPLCRVLVDIDSEINTTSGECGNSYEAIISFSRGSDSVRPTEEPNILGELA